jgi:hypothetical protein
MNGGTPFARAAWWALPFRVVLIGPLAVLVYVGRWAETASLALSRWLP